jgi:hypothetical protein
LYAIGCGFIKSAYPHHEKITAYFERNVNNGSKKEIFKQFFKKFSEPVMHFATLCHI